MQKHKDFQRFLKVFRDPLECVWDAWFFRLTTWNTDLTAPDMVAFGMISAKKIIWWHWPGRLSEKKSYGETGSWLGPWTCHHMFFVSAKK